MDNQPNDLKYKALQSSIYCPRYNPEEIPIDSIVLEDGFDAETIIDHIKNSVDLLSYNKAYKPIMVEIINVIDQHKSDFLIDYQKYISFYWNGIFVYRIEMTGNANQKKQLHISVPTYKKRKEEIFSEDMTTKFLRGGIIASLVLGSIVVGFTLFRYGYN